MTDPYGALATQRKGDMGYFNGSQWTPSSNGHSDPFGSVPATGVQFFFGTLAAPISTPGASFKVVRVEKFDTTVGTFQPDGNAAIYGATYSQPGNKGQPNAIGGITYGYAEGGAYLIGGFFNSQHTVGANVGGQYGGSLGVYIGSESFVDHAAMQGLAMDVRNQSTLDGNDDGHMTGIDMSLGGAGGHSSTVTVTSATPAVVTWTASGLTTLDIVRFTASGSLPTGISANTDYWVTTVTANTFKISTSRANCLAGTFVNTSSTGSGVSAFFYGRFGNGIQFRAVTGGATTMVKALAAGGDWTTGIDLSAVTINGDYMLMDSQFKLSSFSGTGGDPIVQFDSGDFIAYSRSTNAWTFATGNSGFMFVGSGVFAFTNLPNADPGAGSKQFWYDVGGFVHYSP